MTNNCYLGRLLIVDDDETTCMLLRAVLGNAGFRVETANDLDAMQEIVRRYTVDAILLDLDLGKQNGLDGLTFLLAESPFSKVFILTANATVSSAVQALQSGATGYITKDTPPDQIVAQISAHLRHTPTRGVFENSENFVDLGLIGRSDAHQELCRKVAQLKNVDSTILILGESGTGKEVVARTLHRISNRSGGRFEAINCAAIPEHLLESELFGHKRGAFTDAKCDRKGIFELCSGGTLLLDEIGDMPPTLQTKLLRVLQERVIVPVGSSTPIPIDVRVIAATHRDLLEEIAAKRFREDLYYRLSVVPIIIPPLRHRKEDIPMLVDYFTNEFNHRFGKSIKPAAPELMQRIMAYDWPGNIRELRNSIERAVVLSLDQQLHLQEIFQNHRFLKDNMYDKFARSDSSADIVNGAQLPLEVYDLPLTEAKQCFERVYIQQLMKKTSGNITEASKKCGRYRADIYKLIEKYHLSLDEFRAS